jgi:putative heme-binding domain-containing protein
VNAVRLLGLDPTRSSNAALEELLDLNQPVKIQTAAATALWAKGAPEAGRVLLARWKSYPVPVREAVLGGFFADTERLKLLLDAVEDMRVEPSTLGRTRINQLTHSRDQVVKKRAQALLAKVTPLDRKSVLDRYRPALTMTGDPERGKEVFRANCASCHKIGDIGVEVGPDLVNLATRRSKGFLMADIFDPNANIAAGYEEYLIETTDGRTLTGIIASDSATTVVLRRKEGAEDAVLRRNIANLRASAVSAMPEELEKNITIAAMADLLAFLKSVGRSGPPATASGR